MTKLSERALLERLTWVSRYMNNAKYSAAIERASRYFDQSDYVRCSEELKGLPTVESLTDDLIGKLRGKSVYKTIERILSERGVDQITRAKGLSSLLTHVIIEMKERPEYAAVARVIIEKLNSVIFEM